MSSLSDVLFELGRIVVSFLLVILLAIGAFYVTVFVVSTGAGLAGYEPSGNFVVLSAALLVVAGLLGGIPLAGRRTGSSEADPHPSTGFE